MLYFTGSTETYLVESDNNDVGASPFVDNEIDVLAGETSGWDAYSRKDNNMVSRTVFNSSLKFVTASTDATTKQYDYLLKTDGMFITGAGKMNEYGDCEEKLAKYVSLSDCTVTEDSDDSGDSDDGGMAVWAIILIIVLALALVALLIFLCMRRNKKQQDQKSIIYGGPAIEQEDQPMMNSASDLVHD